MLWEIKPNGIVKTPLFILGVDDCYLIEAFTREEKSRVWVRILGGVAFVWECGTDRAGSSGASNFRTIESDDGFFELGWPDGGESRLNVVARVEFKWGLYGWAGRAGWRKEELKEEEDAKDDECVADDQSKYEN